ncbi:MAG: hypothetical protein EXQ50_09595 [Acidobacteria bacterium]|nr:hypothetical protein [Acidobacteriota bacterium]MSO62328.1 hypothetical protein [Acidobacteriota bacterium]
MEQALFDAIKAGKVAEVRSLAANHPALAAALVDDWGQVKKITAWDDWGQTAELPALLMLL